MTTRRADVPGLNGLRLGLLIMVLVWMAGCAQLPRVTRSETRSLPAATEGALAALWRDPAFVEGRSGFWPMPISTFALDARVTMIRQARHSVDLQYYLLADDGVGRLLLRELRDAARRGVRVRLLLDDLYTQGLDPLLLGLQAEAGVEVRLFNPFVSGRDSSLGRFVALAGDFRRLNHRMHNKLIVADGAVAIVGGRNLADEYFFRSKDANFLDMDLLIAGPLVPQLGTLFDEYWNSEQVFPLHAIVLPIDGNEALRRDFERRTGAGADEATPVAGGVDPYGQAPLSDLLARGQRPRWVVAEAAAHADRPAKAAPGYQPESADDTVTLRFLQLLREARREVLVFSPYFIPGEKGIARLREARQAGIEVRVITNALGTSDEPLVNLSYHKYRHAMLTMGVQLFELSAGRLTRDPELRRALGGSRGRLHAKMSFVDRQLVLVGSMNLDLRSALINTELGLAVRSPELARMILETYRADSFAGVYQVRLRADGAGVEWVGRDTDGEVVLDDEPEVGTWDRIRLWFLSLFVPEDLL